MAALHLVPRARRALARLVRRTRGVERRAVHLAPDGEPVGRALLSYIVDPFLAPLDAPLTSAHTHYWESREIGRILVALGFAVDVIHWTHTGFVPAAPYDLLIDVRINLERLAPRVGPDCLKVMHVETAHPSFYNPAQRARVAALAARRGVVLPPYKEIAENRAIESADCATILGNERTQATYRFAGKPLYPVPISQPVLYPFPAGKELAAARREFLWFGSGGLVHKGLDLVLDAFAGLPDLGLAVVGPVDRERPFEHAFERELYRLPNVRTHGWMDIEAPAFLELARRTLALVYPSCSEGQSGGTVTCMHAGLVPVVTPEVGVDVAPEWGVILAEPTVEAIRRAVVELSQRPPGELEAMARAAWGFARAHHTRERFSTVYRAQMLAILERFRPALRARIAAGAT
jgi:glycosyltransferase involved in cell wall biosynthesis